MVHIENLIIGGGQAGLATSYYLTEKGIENIVLEQSSQPGSVWKNRCWDSFTLVTPNWAFRMPGFENNILERDGFLPLKNLIQFFEDYIEKFQLPVKFNIKVNSVEMVDSDGYLVQTNEQTYKAKNVIAATGFFQQPDIPHFAEKFSKDVIQIHSSKYRNPESIKEGAVLVVGSGQSGSQIAEELHNSGRKVFLCVGTSGRAPRRYRGKDIIEWLDMMGFFSLTVEQLPPEMGKFASVPHLSGTKGGHTINLHQFAMNGITLLGKIKGAENNTVYITPDLHESLKKVDQFEVDATNMIDGFINKSGLNAPPEDLPKFHFGYEQPLIEELDLKKEEINTIIWAKGYTYDYSLIKLPVFDQDGFPIQKSGVAEYPGLYFVGIPWMPSEKSGSLIGVAESAKYIASDIAEKVKIF